MTAIEVMPLQVRLAAAVCACGCLAQEHNYSATTGRRTGCSHVSGPGVCACLAYDHAVDRYAVSTYVDVLAGDPAPQMALQAPRDTTDDTDWTRAERGGRDARCCDAQYDGWLCTRKRCHDGSHAAGNGTRVLQRW